VAEVRAFWHLKFHEKSTNCRVNNKAYIIKNEEAKRETKRRKVKKNKERQGKRRKFRKMY